MADIQAFATMGVQGVIDALQAGFERASGQCLTPTFNTSKMLLQALRSGATPDVVVVTRDGIDGLIAEGIVVQGSDVTLARSLVGLAVRKGAPKPDISTPAAFREAVLAAKSIGYSEPAGGGASGVHFEKLMHQLGIADAVKPKSKHPPVGTHTADMLLTGEVDLAVQQVAELKYVQGIDLLGPLPDELQLVTVFVGGIHTKAQHPDAAKALVAFLHSPEGAQAFRDQGMEPV
jgi:molybdate transport system substrate-binding protein